MGDDRTFTQEDVDDIVKQRVSREKAKYAQLEVQISQLEETVQTLTGERDALKKQADKDRASLADLAKVKRDALVLEVATAKGVPEALRSRLVGETKEDLEKDADTLMQAVPDSVKRGVPPTPRGGGKPIPQNDLAAAVAYMMDQRPVNK